MASLPLLLLLAGTALSRQNLPPLPWHLVDVWWDFEAPDADFESLSLDVAIDRDMPAKDYNLYIAPISGGFESGADFYGGLQTNVGGYPAGNPADRSGPYQKGKGAIFSRWGEDLDLSYVRAEPGGFIESAGYEGDFVSGRRLLSWKAGTYTFELRRVSTETIGGRAWTWVAATIIDRASKERVRVSTLKFSGARLRLKPRFASFVEFYGGKEVDIEKLPPLEIRFGVPLINGEPAILKRVEVRYPDGPGEPAAPPIMDAALSADGTQVVCRLHDRPLEGRVGARLLPPSAEQVEKVKAWPHQIACGSRRAASSASSRSSSTGRPS